jgi:DNA-binding winged helix-turn-helix (wHTH) protein
VFVSQLRRKIEPDPRRPRAIVTEPGIGYRWSEQPVEDGYTDAGSGASSGSPVGDGTPRT